MVVDSELRTAPMLWADLLREYPIVAVTGVHYWPIQHGLTSTNIPIVDFKGMELDDTFGEGKWPIDSGGPYKRDWEDRDKRQQFAIGSLVYIWVGENGGSPFGWEKAGAKYFCYEQEMNFKFMTDLQIVTPMAVPLFDFDCINSPDKLASIVSVMSNSYSFCDWSILDSGGSFHLVMESMVRPQNLPYHYGKLIKSFAHTNLLSRQHIFEGIGQSLIDNWHNNSELWRISDDVIQMISHYDEPLTRGIPFIVDLKHLAHTIQELVRFLNGESPSFGYIRISEKDGIPPFVVADYKSDVNNITYYPIPTRPKDLQLRLEGI